MRHSSELERIIHLLVMTADILERSANAEEGIEQVELSSMASTIEDVADRLVDLLFPAENIRQ